MAMTLPSGNKDYALISSETVWVLKDRSCDTKKKWRIRINYTFPGNHTWAWIEDIEISKRHIYAILGMD